MQDSKLDNKQLTIEAIEFAVDAKMTPEDLLREYGLSSVRKLNEAIREAHRIAALADANAQIRKLVKNRKNAVLAAPVEEDPTPVEGKKAADKPASAPVAEVPVQDITKLQNGAPEDPANVSVPKNAKGIAKEAIKKGFVIASDSIIKRPELVMYCVSKNPDGAFVPEEELHTVLTLIERGRIPEEAEKAAEMVKWLQENLPRGDEETREGDHVLQKAPIDLVINGADSSMKPRSVRFVKHVMTIRKSTKYTEAIAMTGTLEIRNLLDEQD